MHAKNNAAKKGVVLGLTVSAFWFLIFSALSVAFYYGVKLMQDPDEDFDPGDTLTVSLMSCQGVIYRLTSCDIYRLTSFDIYILTSFDVYSLTSFDIYSLASCDIYSIISCDIYSLVFDIYRLTSCDTV